MSRDNGIVSAFEHEVREVLSPAERARLFLLRGGRCHRCKREIRSGEKWYDEHLISLSNGGTNEIKNRGISCKWCFPEKNAEDAAKTAHNKRVAIRHNVHSDDLHGRKPGMPGTRRSGWKKKMDGSTVRRER